MHPRKWAAGVHRRWWNGHHAATPRVVSTWLRRVMSVRGYAASRPLGTPQVVENFFSYFSLHIGTICNNFGFGEKFPDDFSIFDDHAGMPTYRPPRYPPGGWKIFFSIFPCILALFATTFSLTINSLLTFQKSRFFTSKAPRYPRVVEKIFFFAFPQYWHYIKQLLFRQ